MIIRKGWTEAIIIFLILVSIASATGTPSASLPGQWSGSGMVLSLNTDKSGSLVYPNGSVDFTYTSTDTVLSMKNIVVNGDTNNLDIPNINVLLQAAELFGTDFNYTITGDILDLSNSYATVPPLTRVQPAPSPTPTAQQYNFQSSSGQQTPAPTASQQSAQGAGVPTTTQTTVQMSAAQPQGDNWDWNKLAGAGLIISAFVVYILKIVAVVKPKRLQTRTKRKPKRSK